MNAVKSVSELKQIPFFSRFTDEQIRRQYERNIDGLESMRARSIKTGKKIGGFTADALKDQIDKYKSILK